MFTYRDYEELDARSIDDQYLLAVGEAQYEAEQMKKATRRARRKDAR